MFGQSSYAPPSPLEQAGRARALAIAISTLQLFWATLMLAAALFKLFEFGVLSYTMHYTNWSWTLQLAFYFGSALAPIAVAFRERGALRMALRVFVAVVFVPLNGVVFVVAALVMVLLVTRSQFLAAYFAEHAPSFVMLGNDVYHFLPVIALLIYLIINWRFVAYSVNWLLRDGERWLMVLYLAFGGTAITLLAYAVFFDPRVVYSTDIGYAAGGLFIAAILVVFNLAPLMAAVYFFGLGRRQMDDRWLEANYPVAWSDAKRDDR